MTRPLLAALFALVAAAGPAEDAKKPNYYPLAKGNKWEYRLTLGDGKALDAVSELTDIRAVDGKPRASVKTKIGESDTSEEVSADDKGVYRHSFAGAAAADPILIFKYPPKGGENWKQDTKIAGMALSHSSKMRGEEEVKVPAGTYKAYPVDVSTTIAGQEVAGTSWYADGVGIVKQKVKVGREELLMELVKFTPGK